MDRWHGVRDATAFGPTCPQTKNSVPGEIGAQFSAFHPPGEDCLNLNVWTPDPGVSGLPVFVWIHGGTFVAGAGSDPLYDGTAFARDGVVAVTINYRMGIQGFLQVDGAGEAGSRGMLDQMAALVWVQEHIGAFGGDPSKVTIAGESAGGTSVGTLLGSPAARGLFQRAIPQSGAAHGGMSLEAARQVATIFSDLSGVPATVAALRQLPLERLLEVEEQLTAGFLSRQPQFLERVPAMDSTRTFSAYQPVWNDVLPERLIDGIRSGTVRGVEVLVGTMAE